MNRKRIGYTISVVSEKYGIHPQTLRSYEREGLITPSRSQGNTRLYSDQDLERLELVLTLTRELRVNLAGVEVILHMRRRMEQMQGEVRELLEFLHQRLGLGPEFFDERMKDALIRVPPRDLVVFSPPRRRKRHHREHRDTETQKIK